MTSFSCCKNLNSSHPSGTEIEIGSPVFIVTVTTIINGTGGAAEDWIKPSINQNTLLKYEVLGNAPFTVVVGSHDLPPCNCHDEDRAADFNLCATGMR